MSKIQKSRYLLYKNFEEDVNSHFLFKIKRRDITRKLFSYANILNRIKPIRLSDLLIRKKKTIRGIVSRDTLKSRKIKHFYGFKAGRTKMFNKFSYKTLQKYRRNRLSNSLMFIESRIDVMLVRLQLFLSIFEARNFIKTNGVFINNSLVQNISHRLTAGDILSFSNNDCVLLKRKLYILAKSRPFSVSLNIMLSKNLIMRELGAKLTLYAWLFRRCTKSSSFLFFGFPRYVEVNLNSMEFYFYGKIKQYDVSYPFKLKINERSNFFSNCI